MLPFGNTRPSKEEVMSQKEGWILQMFRHLFSASTRTKSLPGTRNQDQNARVRILRRHTKSSEAFQLLLRERALEVKQEAEEKRQEDLRQIMDTERKSTTEKNPLKLFPREIWLKLLDIMYPEDFLHAHATIPREQLKLRTLCVLRLVCRSFRDGVDGFLESRILNLMRTFEFAEIYISIDITDPGFHSIQLDPCQFWGRVRNLQQFSISRGPMRFVLRSLHITFYCYFCLHENGKATDGHGDGRRLSERIPIFKDNITQFLLSAGDQILHFKLKLPSASDFRRIGVPLSQEDICDILREWLALMPNLKWLQIDASELEDLNNLRKTPIIWPSFEKLERFDFRGCIKDVPIWRAIVSANPQIKIINMVPIHGDSIIPLIDRLKPEVDVYINPSVLNLQLEIARFGKRLTRYWNFPPLAKQIPGKSNWKLKRLSLWMAGYEGECPDSLDSVFEFIQNFQTLEDVEIHMKLDTQIKVGSSFLLLPNLKHFRLEFSREVKSKSVGDQDFFYSLMFLLECRKLETLFWEHELYPDQSDPLSLWRKLMGRKEKMKIGFMAGFEDLRKSNIWDVFPKLRTIKIRANSPWKKRIGFDNRFKFDWDFKVYQDRQLVEEYRVDCMGVRITTKCTN